MSTFPTPEELKGAVQGTLLYIFVYGAYLVPFQSFSKFYICNQKKKEFKNKQAKDGGGPKSTKKGLLLSVKYYNSDDILALTGDRAVGNFLEQALIFLPLYWMHALFVDPTKSFTIALIYSLSRAIYPFVFLANFKGYVGALGLSTVPGYLVTMYLFYQITTNYLLAD